MYTVYHGGFVIYTWRSLSDDLSEDQPYTARRLYALGVESGGDDHVVYSGGATEDGGVVDGMGIGAVEYLICRGGGGRREGVGGVEHIRRYYLQSLYSLYSLYSINSICTVSVQCLYNLCTSLMPASARAGITPTSQSLLKSSSNSSKGMSPGYLFIYEVINVMNDMRTINYSDK